MNDRKKETWQQIADRTNKLSNLQRFALSQLNNTDLKTVSNSAFNSMLQQAKQSKQ